MRRLPRVRASGERTISLDSRQFIQALERKYPDLPMQPSQVLRREFEYIRHGTLSWFLNFDVVNGQVIEPSWGPTRNEEDALAHLQRLIASDPHATKWHLMLDNLNIHQLEALVRWIAEREGIDQEIVGVKGESGNLRSMESRAAFLHDPTHQVVFYVLVASTAPMRKRFTPYERRDLLQIICAGFFLPCLLTDLTKSPSPA